MNPEDLKELKEAAARATPGPWEWGDWSSGESDVGLYSTSFSPKDALNAHVASGSWHNDSTAGIGIDEADAKFIALANPSTISALIERIEERNELIQDARAFLVYLWNNYELEDDAKDCDELMTRLRAALHPQEQP